MVNLSCPAFFLHTYPGRFLTVGLILSVSSLQLFNTIFLKAENKVEWAGVYPSPTKWEKTFQNSNQIW